MRNGSLCCGLFLCFHTCFVVKLYSLVESGHGIRGQSTKSLYTSLFTSSFHGTSSTRLLVHSELSANCIPLYATYSCQWPGIHAAIGSTQTTSDKTKTTEMPKMVDMGSTNSIQNQCFHPPHGLFQAKMFRCCTGVEGWLAIYKRTWITRNGTFLWGRSGQSCFLS